MVVHGDLLEQKGLLVQQVNCRGAMGRGLALAIRQKWPQVYLHYRQAYQRGQWKLGMVQIIRVEDDVWVANLAGQDEWGTHKVQTNPFAVHAGFAKVYQWAQARGVPVYAPWRFGCGLAGGDWEIVKPLVEKYCPGVTWVINETGRWEQAENYVDPRRQR